MNYPEVDMPKGFVAYKLSVTGLKGGHSGMDINIGRANSNKILFRFLTYATHFYDLRIAEINGGSLRNAIPRESFAIVAISEKEASKFEGEVAKFEKIFKQEFSKSEPDLQMKVEKTNAPAKIMANDEMHKICKAVYACPHGVQRMSDAMPGLVETSNNLAIVKCINGKFAVHCLVRSSVDTAKEGVMYKIGGLFNLIGAEVAYEGAYPGWKPNMDSPILKTMLKTYEKLYNKTPEIKAIHAGLECGILGAAYPNWDMISFGPTIRYPHSPDERILISSVEKFWNYMVETLKNIPVKE
jgi:dipeptidase D